MGGFADSVLAALLPAFLLFILYALKMLGAGDIKLFCAIGAVMGIRFILYGAAFSFLAGGVMALILMAIRRNSRERLSHLFTYLKNCFLTRSLLPYTDFHDKSDGSKFRFSYAIACGTLTALYLTP